MRKIVCCFIGHRKIEKTNALVNKLRCTIEKLIKDENVNAFLFGSKSQFNDLCYEITSELKYIYPHIVRIYVRAEFPYIDEEYRKYLLQKYEKTYFPENILNAGRASYIERNFEMINKSDFCIMYYDENYIPCNKKSTDQSGTKIAYNYAVKKKRKIINVFTA